jgi:exopolysaccharide biosynthesis polyprenyl glycosylphosphotransferase
MKSAKSFIRINAKIFQRVLDIFVTSASYFIACYLTSLIYNKFAFTNDYVYMLLLIIPTWLILTKTNSLAQIPRSRTYLSILFNLVNFSLLGFFAMLLFKHLFRFNSFSHYFILNFSIVNLIAMFVYRISLYKFAKLYRASGHNIHNLVIVADENSEEIIDKILDHNEWGYRIVMIFSDSKHIRKTYAPMIKVLPERSNIKNVLRVDIIDEVLYCKKDVDLEKVDSLIAACKELGITLKVQSNVAPIKLPNFKLTHLEKTPFLTFINTPNYSLQWVWKAISDYIIATTMLFFLSPIFLLISLAIRIDSKGPVIFKQKRVGLRGRQFYIYKFRTMVQNAEELKAKLMTVNESDGPTFKMKNDPRITFMGRFLRKTSLDELPQLFNVLRGEMSLIGPRPPLPNEVNQYEDWHLRRLSVKPGITCTWQIVPNRNEVVFDKWMKLDIQYIEEWSLISDWRLFFKTIKSVLINKGY